MPITEYGMVVRELRDEVDASLRQMADEIGLSPTYISAVEIGEKGITDDLIEKVIGFLRKRGLKNKEFARLRAAVDRTRRSVDVSELNASGRRAVAAFARQWTDLDRNARENFLKQLDIADEER